MKKIKVRALLGSWQGYQEIVNYPPKGIEYQGISKGTSQGTYYESKKMKEFLSRIIQKIKISRMIFVKPGNYDLIHSSRGIIPLNKKPWVMDVEHAFSFTGLDPKLLKRKGIKKFVERKLAQKNCKALLCHCEASKKSFFKFLDCKKFKDKIDVLYPASHIVPIKKKSHKKIRILCILSLFRHKAGLQVLKAFSELEKKYNNIELWMRSDVPKELRKKYNSKNIRYMPYFGEILSREKLLEDIYGNCDIFLYPTFCDSFGYSQIDALVAGLPIIGTNMFAVPEVVEEGKNGLIIEIPGYDVNSGIQEHLITNMTKDEEERFVSDMVKAIEKLVKNKKLREKMGKESFKLVSEGKFSIKERNKKLRKVYEDALRK